MGKFNINKWSRHIHRELSYVFTGMLLTYAISGFVMNHKRDFNGNYSIKRSEIKYDKELRTDYTKEEATALLSEMDPDAVYMKHYSPKANVLKFFIQGGTTLELNTETGEGVFETIRKRPLISGLTKLHYNPSRAWTIFSDLFIFSLVLIIISGILMKSGNSKSTWRKYIEVLLGIGIVVVFMVI